CFWSRRDLPSSSGPPAGHKTERKPWFTRRMSKSDTPETSTRGARESARGVYGTQFGLARARFVLMAAGVAASVGLGIGSWGLEEVGHAVPARIPELRLDANSVPPGVLTALPHIGPALVDRWVKARQERPFRSLDDARTRVRGMGAATFAQIAPFFEE